MHFVFSVVNSIPPPPLWSRPLDRFERKIGHKKIEKGGEIENTEYDVLGRVRFLGGLHYQGAWHCRGHYIDHNQ